VTANFNTNTSVCQDPFEAVREHFSEDWSQFIEFLLGPPRKRYRRGREFIYLCPLHEETEPSFNFNISKGVFKCFGCNANGDAIELWAKLKSCSLKEAALQVCEIFHILDEEPRRLSLAGYAQAKKLDIKVLEEFGLRDGKQGLEIPYFDEQGREVAVRIRLAMRGENRFCWRSGDRPILYGLWKLRDWPRTRVYLVEGESDCHTLWQVGLLALGIPGKTTFKTGWIEYFRSFNEVVIVEEPNAREEMLKIAHAITRASKNTQVFALRLPVKDVSELWMKDPCPEQFKAALEEADLELLDFKLPHLKAEWRSINQDPMRYCEQFFKLPSLYVIERGRLIRLAPNDKVLRRIEVAPRPIIIGGRYRDERNEVWTEVAWAEGEGWAPRLIPRQEALDRRTVLNLARWGAPVSSENAAAVAKFLLEFEESNRALLKPRRASTQMGWVRAGEIFLLGERAIGGDVRFIPLGDEEERLAQAYEPRGDERVWIELFEELGFCPSPSLARFIVSAAFAAPLVRLLGERSALVYIYGESGVGKTAILHLALSAWGNPNDLIGTAFSTAVGLERRAALFCDLPMTVDERQAATHDRFVDQAVYMLSSGQSKGRGQKEGGLQAVARWRSIILMTGEQDLTGSAWTGIENRTLQLYLSDLLPEEFSRRIYKATAENYGHLGPNFIKKLLSEGAEKLQERRRKLEKKFEDNKAVSGSKLALITLASVAEWVLLEVIGHPEDEAFAMTLNDIGEVLTRLSQTPMESLADRARDYVLSKFAEFQAEARARSRDGLGLDDRAFVEGEEGDDALLYVLPSVFEKWLAEGGVTKRRVLQDFEARGWLVTSDEGSKRRYTVRKRSPHSWERINRYYCLRLSAMELKEDNVPTGGDG
jgi:putative DNA primase/helicase